MAVMATDKYERMMNAVIPPEMVLSNQIREVSRAYMEDSDRSEQATDEYVKVLLSYVGGAIMSLEERVLRLEGVDLGHVGDPI